VPESSSPRSAALTSLQSDGSGRTDTCCEKPGLSSHGAPLSLFNAQSHGPLQHCGGLIHRLSLGGFSRFAPAP
jgi:hypothetical protein